MNTQERSGDGCMKVVMSVPVRALGEDDLIYVCSERTRF